MSHEWVSRFRAGYLVDGDSGCWVWQSVSFGATVTIVCGNEVSAARWKARTPDGVLPESGVRVQVVTVDMRGAA